ncbi:transcription factor [Asimina triloba]
MGEMAIQRMSSRANGGLSRNSESSIELATGITPKRGMVLPFTPLAMSFDEVNYYVDMPAEMKQQGVAEDRLQLLRGVTGAFRPGVLTALMGVSGAGKTTLMDVLAGRKTGGYIEGDIRISGFPKNQETFARISGYCEQNDIHSPQVTVRESLIYSAFLRLPKDVNDAEKMIFVDEVMELVELENLKDAIVGLPGITGLSTEQRKRLTIAVELVANPSIIFMDEPTSGLDARAAAIVMRTVRNTVDTGRTVVCTIHQPSIDIFEAFDEAVPGVPKIKEKYNPATWMLEASSIATEVRLGVDFAEHYTSSQLYQAPANCGVKGWSTMYTAFPVFYEEDVSMTARNCKGSNSFHCPKAHPHASVLNCYVQIVHLPLIDFSIFHFHPNPISHREMKTTEKPIIFLHSADVNPLIISRRNKALIKELSAPAPGAKDLYFPTQYSQPTIGQFKSCLWKQSLTYWRSPDYNLVRYFFTLVASLMLGTIFWKVGTKRENAGDLTIVIGAMYSAVLFVGINNCSTVQPIVAVERTVFYRERAAGMYSALPYGIAQTTYYTLVVYSMVSFQWAAAKFLWFFFVTFFTFLYFTYYGMMTVSITPNHQVAAIFAAAFYGVFNLFSGFFIPRPYGDVEDIIKVPGAPDQTIKFYVEDHFGYKRDFIGPVAAVLVGFTVFFAFMFAYCIKVLNFQNR